MSSKRYIISLIVTTLLMINGCHHDSQHKNSNKIEHEITTATNTLVIHPQNHTSHLYFQGIIAPIQITPLTSSIDGVVEARLFNYGDTVKKGATLFHIKSDAFEKEYQNSLSEFLKAQENYMTNHEKKRSSEELWSAGLISRNDHNAQINAAADASLSLKLARQKLIALLKSGGILDEQATKDLATYLQALTITNVAAVNRALNIDVSLIKLHAPADGITLMASQQQDNNQSSGHRETLIGATVKPQDVLVLIGNMSGITIHIKVNEIDINHLKLHQAATITGTAFPDVTLQGEITALNTQANDEGSSNLPTFSVTITVPHLSVEQQQKIHVGMSTQVEITLHSPAVISIPLSAIQHQEDQETVTIIDPETKKTRTVAVKTGRTDPNNVVILDGLKEGETIVINHPTP